MTTSHHNASRHAGLILIHRFPLELLFHSHRSLPIPSVATIYEPAYFTWPSLHFFEPFVPLHLPPSLPPIPLALTLYPLYLPSLPLLSLSLLEDVDDDAFLDCSHKYRGLQSDEAYCLSGIVCDTFLPPHGAVNWSERNSSTLV